MDDLWRYAGDLYEVLPPHWAGIVLVLCSLVCGLLIGAEREAKQKPAGLRTLALICVGSTIFTLASILIAGTTADRTRITAQVVTGVGFLGAGAILHHRGTVVGLTTGATVWLAAAIGVLVGGGYAVAGVVLTVVVLLTLIVVGRIEHRLDGACRFTHCRIIYDAEHGKTLARIQHVLDEYRIPDRWRTLTAEGDRGVIAIRHCDSHPEHRGVLAEIAAMPAVLELHCAGEKPNTADQS